MGSSAAIGSATRHAMRGLDLCAGPVIAFAAMNDATLNESQFDRIADDTLKALTSALDEVGEALDVEYANGILNVDFAAGGAPYVINSHRAARQIWVSAEQRAGHYSWDGSRWLDTKTGEELFAKIESLLTARLGQPIALARPKR